MFNFLTRPWFVSISLLSLACLTAASGQVNILTQRYDNARTGANLAETILTPTTVSSSFGKLFTLPVDGAIYAQPLLVSNLAIPGKGTHNVLFVVTMNDVVYAFDADSNSGSNATPLWTVSFVNAAAGITAVPITDITVAKNIQENVGIESTPVIDLPSNTLYLVARTKENGAYYQRIHALDITTGAERPNSPATISGSVSGTGIGSVNNTIKFDPLLGNQRAGLAIANHQLLISWASHEDYGPYHGWIMSYDITTLRQTGIVCTTPNGMEGGIWMSGWAPAVDSSNFVYFSIGNGTWDARRNFGESVIKMSLSERLAIVDFFTPGNWAALNSNDDDLGSTGVLLMPGSTVALTASKHGSIYAVNTSKLGWETSTDSQIVQSFDMRQINQYAYSAKGGPVFWNRPGATKMVYIQNEADPVHGFPVLPNGGGTGIPKLDLANVQASQEYSPYFGGGVLALSGDAAGQHAIVWSTTCVSGTSGGDNYCPGILRALDADGLSLLWDSSSASFGNWAKFVPPVVANGKVYLATFSNKLVVYGLTQ